MSFDLEYARSLCAVGGLSLRYAEETGSTNADLLAGEAAPDGAVLIAGRQSAGRGRLLRSFASPEGGLYMSVLFRAVSPDRALAMTPRAAVAVCGAIEAVSGRKTAIKWVNDVLVGGKKVCGILAEARAGESLDVVLGIGVNVSAAPEGVPGAGAVFSAAPEKAREQLAAEILNRLFTGTERLYEEYLSRCVTIGRRVSVLRGGERFEALAVGLDRRFRLIIDRGGGREALDSGEVSLHA